MRAYEEFLETKAIATPADGFEVEALPPWLFDFQAAIVRWALRLGRAAIFAGTGLGKTAMQLVWAREICWRVGGPVIIIAPLAVAEQTMREGIRFGVSVNRCKDRDDIMDGINITNYERLDRFDLTEFVGIVLDESSILKSQDGVTRTALINAAQSIPYRLACTATPSPNDFMELGNHAEFVGAMTRGEMLSMFFINDQDTTQKWRLKGHAEDAFWQWICSWAVMLDNPLQLGYDGSRFVLPPLNMHSHQVASLAQEGLLLPVQALTLLERREARRASLDLRVAKCIELVQREPDKQWLIWCDFNAEGDALEHALAGSVQVKGPDEPEFKVQSALRFIDGRIQSLISKPSIFGFGLNLQNCSRMAFVGLSDSFEQFYQAVRRCWRFGQTDAVDCHVITSEAEGAVLMNIKRKEAYAERMRAAMIRNLRVDDSMPGPKCAPYDATKTMEVPSWMNVA